MIFIGRKWHLTFKDFGEININSNVYFATVEKCELFGKKWAYATEFTVSR